ncbi:MAG: SDR family NAD(P)-dependent oxidoreductase [Bacteroidales bacterium]|nr:SDR family NAD(P)-dependent oxidoreductase [Bacteroidales bacterium]MCF8338313.1 SDR family NAD(P)-dependent oxidoreductase [Bacteroidales bacterium]
METTSKTCLITGSNSGIGKETAIQLARKDYHLILLVREGEKSRNALKEIRDNSGSENIDMIFTDLSSLNSIEKAVQQIKTHSNRLDILINNAGVYKRNFEKSPEGFEMTLAVNYLAPFYLTRLLLPLLEQSSPARIVNVTSGLYKNGKTDFESFNPEGKFNGLQAYADTKLLLIYFTYYLADILEDKNITVNAVHPGVVATYVFRELPAFVNKLLKLLVRNPTKGAKPSIYVATSPDLEGVTGKHFDKMQMAPALQSAYDENEARQILEKSEKLINREMPGISSKKPE